MTSTSSRQLHITLCNKVATTKVEHIDCSWQELAQLLCEAPRSADSAESRDRLAWPLFVPFKMKSQSSGARMTSKSWGTHYSRCKENVEVMDLLVIDVDNDPKHIATRPYLSFEDAKVAFTGLACVFYTSFNHKNTHKHNVDKFRVVLPLAAPATLADVEARKTTLAELFPFADPASFTASQPFYLPITHPDRASRHSTWKSEGEWLDLLKLDAAPRPEPVKPTVTFVQTDQLADDLPTIKLKSGISYRADELWNVLAEGYEGRMSCFRIGVHDKKPGCFVFRKGPGLMYHDPTGPTRQFIIVYRSTIRPTADTDLPTAPMWKRRVPDINQNRPQDRQTLEYIEHAPDITRLSERFLSSDLVDRIPDQGVIAIRSPKGTGKTELLKQVTARCSAERRSVMLLGHRVYLLQNLAVRTNLDYYLELEPGKTTEYMALCMNSLTRINQKTGHAYDTLIIDESEQVFQALISPTLHADLSQIYNNLIWLFKKAKRIICLDADLSADLTLELIREIRGDIPGDDVLGIINEYPIGQDQVTKLYEDKNHLLFDALTAIDAGEKVFIATNNRKQATAIDAIVREMGKTSLLVTAETNEAPATQAFIQDPTNESIQYDVVVSSPTLSTGVSIDGTHFDRVVGLFGLRPGTFQDADQAISRVRKCANVAVWIQGNKNPPYIPDEEAIYNKALNIERGTLKRLYDETQLLTQGQLLWARIYARINWMVQRWSANKDEQFTRLRRELGFVVLPVLKDEESAVIARGIYSQFKDVGTDLAKVIYEASEIDPDEAAELGRKKQRTYEERMKFERYRLKETLKESFNLEGVRKALKQELHKSLGRLQILHDSSDGHRMESDKKDREKNKATISANRHRVIQNELIEHLCTQAQINLDLLYQSAAADDRIEVLPETLAAVATAFEERRRDFNFYFDLRIKDPAHPMNHKKVWNATLGQWMQLPLVKKKLGPRGQQVAHYFIDSAKKDLVLRAHAEANEMTQRILEKFGDGSHQPAPLT